MLCQAIFTIATTGPNQPAAPAVGGMRRSEEHTSELQSRETISYAVFCLKKKKNTKKSNYTTTDTRESTTRAPHTTAVT